MISGKGGFKFLLGNAKVWFADREVPPAPTLWIPDPALPLPLPWMRLRVPLPEGLSSDEVCQRFMAAGKRMERQEDGWSVERVDEGGTGERAEFVFRNRDAHGRGHRVRLEEGRLSVSSLWSFWGIAAELWAVTKASLALLLLSCGSLFLAIPGIWLGWVMLRWFQHQWRVRLAGKDGAVQTAWRTLMMHRTGRDAVWQVVTDSHAPFNGTWRRVFQMPAWWWKALRRRHALSAVGCSHLSLLELEGFRIVPAVSEDGARALAEALCQSGLRAFAAPREDQDGSLPLALQTPVHSWNLGGQRLEVRRDETLVWRLRLGAVQLPLREIRDIRLVDAGMTTALEIQDSNGTRRMRIGAAGTYVDGKRRFDEQSALLKSVMDGLRPLCPEATVVDEVSGGAVQGDASSTYDLGGFMWVMSLDPLRRTDVLTGWGALCTFSSPLLLPIGWFVYVFRRFRLETTPSGLTARMYRTHVLPWDSIRGVAMEAVTSDLKHASYVMHKVQIDADPKELTLWMMPVHASRFAEELRGRSIAVEEPEEHGLL